MGPQLRYDRACRKAQNFDPVSATDLVLLSHIVYKISSIIGGRTPETLVDCCQAYEMRRKQSASITASSIRYYLDASVPVMSCLAMKNSLSSDI